MQKFQRDEIFAVFTNPTEKQRHYLLTNSILSDQVNGLQYTNMNNKENEIDAHRAQFKRVISAQAEVWEGSNGTVSEIKNKFDVTKKTGEVRVSNGVGKVQSTPTKSKVAEIQQKIANHTARVEHTATPSRSVNIPANKVTEMKQKITEVGDKSKTTTHTPSRSVNIPLNKVNEIRKLLASLEKSARDNSDKTLSSKKRAVIDARMNTVSDIMKWIEDMTKHNKHGHLTSSKKGIELPVNRVNEMKNWLLDFERHNKEHFVEGSKTGNKGTIAPKGIANTHKKEKQNDDKEAKIQKDVQIVDEETHPDVLKMISLLNELDSQNKKNPVDTKNSFKKNAGQISKKVAEKQPGSVNQVHDIAAYPEEKPSVHNYLIKKFQADTSSEPMTQIQDDKNQEDSDQFEEQQDVDISMLPRPSEDSMTDESEDWEDIFAELSISSDEGEGLEANGEDSASEENIEGAEVRKLLDSFINCDDSKEQDVVEESPAHLDYSDHESQELSIHSRNSSVPSSANGERTFAQEKGGIISPGINFEADFVNGFVTDELLLHIQPSATEAAPVALVNEAAPSLLLQSKDLGHPIEVYVEKPSASVLVPWRANKKIVIDTKALKQNQNKKIKGKRFGRKLLKALKRMVRMSGNYESERSKEHRIALARTLSESEAASSVVSPLSRFSDHIMTPRAPNVQDVASESYLPTTYTGKIETSIATVPFKGSLTPDQSLASAFEHGLSPDSSSEGSLASNYALVLAKSMNVTQHVQFMRGVFGSPTHRLGDKSGVVIGELSLVASSGEI